MVRPVSKTFVSWMFSYILIMLLPILTGVFAYRTALRVIAEETGEIHAANLRQFRLLLDENLLELNRINNLISSSRNILDYMNYNPPLNAAQEYKKRDIQIYISQQIVYSPFIKDILIYFRKSNLFVGAETVYRSGDFESLCGDKFGISYGTFSDVINRRGYLDYLMVPPREGQGGNILLIRSVVSGYLLSPDAYIILVIDSSRLSQIMHNASQTPGGFTLIMDENNRVFTAGYHGPLPEYLDYRRLHNAPPLFYEDFNGEPLIIIQTSSGVNRWRYVMVIPENIYYKKIKHIRNIIYLYVAFCLLLGLAMSSLLAKKNYRPVEKLLRVLRPEQEQANSIKENEFFFIEKAIKNLVDKNKNAEQRIYLQSRELRNSFLLKLMKGQMRPGEDGPFLEENGISLRGSHAAVIAFKIENPPRGGPEQRGGGDAVFVINTITEELLNKKYTAYTAEEAGTALCLINLDAAGNKDPDLVLEDIRPVLEKEKEYLHRNFGIDFSASLSSLYPAADGICAAYSQAMEILAYRDLAGLEAGVADYRVLPQGAPNHHELVWGLYHNKRIVDSIINGEYEAAYYMIDEYLKEEFTENKLSLQMAVFRVTGLVYSVISALGENKTAIEMDLFNDLNPAELFAESKNPEDLKRSIKTVFEKISEYQRKAEKKPAAVRVREIEDYIKTHFSDHNLSLASICEKFQITPSYFSRIFKKHAGMNLPKYLHLLRINKAKELLLYTDMSVAAVAKESGFYNSRTFERVFKNAEGMAPLRFKPPAEAASPYSPRSRTPT